MQMNNICAILKASKYDFFLYKLIKFVTVDLFRIFYLKEWEQNLWCGNGVEHAERHEECDGPRVVLVGEGNHHIFPPGPYVQEIVGHSELIKKEIPVSLTCSTSLF